MAIDHTQYNAIMREYDQTQAYHRHIQNQHIQEIYEKFPEYKKLDEEIPALSMRSLRAKLSEDSSDNFDLNKAIAEIAEKKNAILLQHGYPKDYLDLSYTCPLCKDTGYIHGDRCSCLKNKILSILYDQSNMSALLDTNNFDTLSEKYYKGDDLLQFQKTVAVCHNFVDNFEVVKDNLLFYGDVGVGKSFLSCCISKELLDRGYSVLYFSSGHLFDVLSKQDFGKDLQENLYTNKEDIYNCDLVVIDDLGTELTNSYVSSQLFSLINIRSLKNKSTIISTNLALKDLRDLYSDRIFSRISTTYKLCKLSGPDIRIYKKQLQ